MSNQVSLVDDIVSEYQGIEMQMADPEVAGDQKQFRKLSKRYAELRPIIMVNDELTQAREDLADAKEMAYEDHDFQEEADRLEKSVESLEEKLADLLAPRDEQDSEEGDAGARCHGIDNLAEQDRDGDIGCCPGYQEHHSDKGAATRVRDNC